MRNVKFVNEPRVLPCREPCEALQRPAKGNSSELHCDLHGKVPCPLSRPLRMHRDQAIR